MSTEFFNDQWRIPSNENQNKVSNYSMDFDGTSGYIDCGDSDKFSFTNGTTDRPFSLSGWVKPDDLTRFRFISKWSASLGYEYMFSTGASDTLSFIINSLGTTSRLGIVTSTLTSTDWQHWVATYDGTGSTTGTNAGMKIYINGVEVTTTDSNSGTYVAMQNTTAPLKIGTEDKNNYYANGKIDQVSIFDYELSSTQVTTLYGGGTAITNPMSLSPIAYYQLGDQSVSTGPTSDYLVPNNSLSDYVFNFDGSNDYIDCGNITALNSQSAFSTSAWINYSGTPTTSSHIILSGGSSATNRFWVQLKSSTEIRYGSGSASAYDVTVSTMSSGTWYHIATVHNGTSLDIYINGIKQGATITVVAPSTQIGNNFKIGEYFSPVGYLWNGQLSNVAVFNTVLSTANIETIYNNGSPLTSMSGFTSLVAWYKLNAADTFDGTDWTINDYGSGGNDGTSSGMTSSNLVVSDLQQTNGFSPYALGFDAINDALTIQNSSTFNLGTAFTISGWFNFGSNKYQGLISFDATSGGSPRGWFLFQISSSNDIRLFDGANIFTLKTSYTTTNQWDSFIITYDGTDLVFYINGNQESTQAVSIDLQTNGNDAQIGNNQFASGRFFDGKISNIAFWNVGLTSTQVTEVFNEGRPSDLHNFSGTAPVSWWQLGSNSSYNSGAWTCLDEIGTNNAVSAGNMTNDAITDGPGYSASGLGTSLIDIKGDAPYSTANGLSNSMDVLDRTTDVPN